MEGTGAIVTPEAVEGLGEDLQEILAVEDNVVFRPNPGPQTEFLASSETECLFSGGKGSSKLLILNTILPTPSGYTTIGDVKVGDYVFAEDGIPTRVVWKSEVETEQAYDIHFSSGEVLTAHAGHMWKVRDIKNRAQIWTRSNEYLDNKIAKNRARGVKPHAATFSRKGAPSELIRTTEELADSLFSVHGHKNYSVDIARPLILPEAELPIDPYTFGLWLGDGDSDRGCFGCLAEDVDDIIQHVPTVLSTKEYNTSSEEPKLMRHVLFAKTKVLKDMGVYKNKHIPLSYLRSSFKQRMEVLHGLMDTDGSVATSGQCAITLKSFKLISDVNELINSLGIKSAIHSRIAKAQNGYSCKVYCIVFTTSIPVFKLSRKLNKQKKGKIKPTILYRYITNITPAGIQPMQCIQVEHHSHTYLVGKTFIKTHNSFGLMVSPLAYCGCKSFRGIIIRRTIPEVRDMIYKARVLYPKAYPGVVWRDSDKMFVFPSGARLEFMSMESLSDLPKLQGTNANFIGVDEIADIPFAEELLTYARANLRTVDPVGAPCRLLLTANPGAVASAYIREQFIDKAPPSTTFWEKSEYFDPRTKEKHITHTSKRHIHSTVFDNPYLLQDPTYLATLSNLPETKRKQWLLGDWFVAENAAFAEFEDAIHVVTPYDIPKSWKRVSGFDWGYSSDSAVVWGAVDPDTQQIIVYREWVFKKKNAMQAAHEGKALEYGENVSIHILDASAWQRRGTLGESIGETLQNYWGKMLPSSRMKVGGALSRVGRKNLIHEYLAVDPTTGRPRLVVTSNCRHFIKCIKGIPLDKHNCEMYDTDSKLDHIIDALGYMLQARPSQRVSWSGPFDRLASTNTAWKPQDTAFGY